MCRDPAETRSGQAPRRTFRAESIAIVLAIMVVGLLSCPTARAASFGFLGAWGSQGTGIGQFDIPSGIALDRAGSVYVADQGNSRVQKFTALGTPVTQWGTSEGQFGANGIAVSPQGVVYVTTYHWVEAYTTSGIYIRRWGDRGTDSPYPIPGGAWAVATDALGQVYVLNQNAFEVQEFTADGRFITAWGSEGSGPGQFGRRDFFGRGQRGFFDGPGGIAVADDGTVYVSDTWNSRVERFSPTGAYLGDIGTPGSGEDQLNEPYGLDVGADGSVYVADQGNSRIQRFSAAGRELMHWGVPYDGELAYPPIPHSRHDGEFDYPIWDVAVNRVGDVYSTDGWWYQRVQVQRFGFGGVVPPGMWPIPVAARPRVDLRITGPGSKRCSQVIDSIRISNCTGFRFAKITWKSNCTGPGVRNGWGLILAIPKRAVPKPEYQDAPVNDWYRPIGLRGPVYAPSPPRRDGQGILRFADGSEVGEAAQEKSVALASGVSALGGSLNRLLLEPGLRIHPYLRAWCTVKTSNGLTDGQGFDLNGAEIATPPYLAHTAYAYSTHLTPPPSVRRGRPTTLVLHLFYDDRMAALDRDGKLEMLVQAPGLNKRIRVRLLSRGTPVHHFIVTIRPPRAGALTLQATIQGLPRSNKLTLRVR